MARGITLISDSLLRLAAAYAKEALLMVREGFLNRDVGQSNFRASEMSVIDQWLSCATSNDRQRKIRSVTYQGQRIHNSYQRNNDV